MYSKSSDLKDIRHNEKNGTHNRKTTNTNHFRDSNNPNSKLLTDEIDYYSYEDTINMFSDSMLHNNPKVSDIPSNTFDVHLYHHVTDNCPPHKPLQHRYYNTNNIKPTYLPPKISLADDCSNINAFSSYLQLSNDDHLYDVNYGDNFHSDNYYGDNYYDQNDDYNLTHDPFNQQIDMNDDVDYNDDMYPVDTDTSVMNPQKVTDCHSTCEDAYEDAHSNSPVETQSYKHAFMDNSKHIDSTYSNSNTKHTKLRDNSSNQCVDEKCHCRELECYHRLGRYGTDCGPKLRVRKKWNKCEYNWNQSQHRIDPHSQHRIDPHSQHRHPHPPSVSQPIGCNQQDGHLKHHLKDPTSSKDKREIHIINGIQYLIHNPRTKVDVGDGVGGGVGVDVGVYDRPLYRTGDELQQHTSKYNNTDPNPTEREIPTCNNQTTPVHNVKYLNTNPSIPVQNNPSKYLSSKYLCSKDIVRLKHKYSIHHVPKKTDGDYQEATPNRFQCEGGGNNNYSDGDVTTNIRTITTNNPDNTDNCLLSLYHYLSSVKKSQITYVNENNGQSHTHSPHSHSFHSNSPQRSNDNTKQSRRIPKKSIKSKKHSTNTTTPNTNTNTSSIPNGCDSIDQGDVFIGTGSCDFTKYLPGPRKNDNHLLHLSNLNHRIPNRSSNHNRQNDNDLCLSKSTIDLNSTLDNIILTSAINVSHTQNTQNLTHTQNFSRNLSHTANTINTSINTSINTPHTQNTLNRSHTLIDNDEVKDYSTSNTNNTLNTEPYTPHSHQSQTDVFSETNVFSEMSSENYQLPGSTHTLTKPLPTSSQTPSIPTHTLTPSIPTHTLNNLNNPDDSQIQIQCEQILHKQIQCELEVASALLTRRLSVRHKREKELLELKHRAGHSDNEPICISLPNDNFKNTPNKIKSEVGSSEVGKTYTIHTPEVKMYLVRQMEERVKTNNEKQIIAEQLFLREMGLRKDHFENSQKRMEKNRKNQDLAIVGEFLGYGTKIGGGGASFSTNKLLVEEKEKLKKKSRTRTSNSNTPIPVEYKELDSVNKCIEEKDRLRKQNLIIQKTNNKYTKYDILACHRHKDIPKVIENLGKVAKNRSDH